MENKFNAFFEACDDFINCKFLVAEYKLQRMLQDLSQNEEICSLIGECLEQFNRDREFAKAFIQDGHGDYICDLPTEEYKVIAFVFCTLVDIDNKKIDLVEFVKRFYGREENPFKAFINQMVVPFRNLLADAFGYPKLKVDGVELNEEDYQDSENDYQEDDAELIFWKKLQYITPIAFQGHIALYGDLKGNIINDIYNKSSNYIIENINICIFPLETETIVMMFISKENKKYYEFIKQFKQLSDQNKLNLIAFIIINYSEDFFISQDASKKILNNVILEMSVKNTTNIIALDEKMLKEIKEIKRHELMNYKSIPNLLDERYALNK